ncbi:GDYXXLXY domain-containing protein [Candidatus Avelusimicrobium luingense]|uniref:GDYXXLXY domain-containing protein n=1 Tax=Candidatus Avelusimicrobium luingense TaxID=3416211 RepID=UPI003D0DD657
MKKRLLLAVFFLPLICLIGWTIFLTVSRNQGTEVKVAVRGYDPRDLLSGHYIAYQIDWAKTDCDQFPDSICPKEKFCHQARWGRQCRFYIPEQYAKELDDLFRKRNSTDTVFEIIYSYRPGHKPLAKEMLINGRAWKAAIK